jgi:hypothetical protein
LSRQSRPWFSLAAPGSVSGTKTVVDGEIAKAEMFVKRPSPPPRPHAERNKAAVAAAYHLLKWSGHKTAATRGGKWEQLARILLRDPTLDLFYHLREFKESALAQLSNAALPPYPFSSGQLVKIA